MKQPFGKVTEFDETWVVQDQRRGGGREAKYTVDAAGIELLRYRDGVAVALAARDRVARTASRVLALLPGRWGTRVVRAAETGACLRSQLADHLLELHARRASWRRGRVVPVGRAWAPHRAVPVPAYDAAAEADLQRAAVLEVLRSSGLDPVVLPAGPGRRPTIAVRGCQADDAWAALAGRAGAGWHVVPLDRDGRRPRRITTARLRRLAGSDGGFRLFRHVAGGPGRLISGPEVGVDLEVWREPHPRVPERAAGTGHVSRAEEDDRLAAPRRGAWSHLLSPTDWEQSAGREGGDLEVSPLPHLFDVVGPIDVVYTWVDDADPLWNEQRIAALDSPQQIALSPAATHAARFRSHDELRYSLRSLEMFAPWVRTVHIVTAGQQPYWLNLDHPRVRLVDHREIFADPSALTVFNSHAIESQLHRVPGLAEHYLYLNDDVFFGRPVAPELFFHGNGIAKFFLSSELIGHSPRAPHDDPVTSAAKNNRELLESAFGRTTTALFQHTPHPQLRSVLEHLEEHHPELLARVAASRFRHPDDLSVASALHHYYAYALGRAVPGRLDYLYLDLGHAQARRRLRRLLRTREFDVFCLNDSPAVSSSAEDSGRLLRDFLSRYFPVPSAFEHGAATPALERDDDLPAAPRRQAA